MKNVFFQPWVGKDYKKNKYFEKKIMVLGESHYCDKKCNYCGDLAYTDCNNFTTTIMNRFIGYKNSMESHESWMNTYTKFANVLLGEKVASETNIDFWNSLLFYNYIQRTLEGSRI